MFHSMKSAGLAAPRPSAKRRSALAAAMLLALVTTIGAGAQAQAAANDAEAKTIFEKFIAAQNAHDADAVKAMLLDSPGTLLFARNVDTRGRDAVASRFKEYYEGTWHLEPDMSKFRVAVISNDVMQVLVPIVFTRGLPGKPPQQNTFLISQTYVQDSSGWHVASIMPVANTELK
ncbi:YybH family protein [Bradyrhizobium rifense]|nr:DUF4440 domain-containing protein [Bradyrhizobium rifense]